jgi:flagellar hook-basal body complex protein FliE
MIISPLSALTSIGGTGSTAGVGRVAAPVAGDFSKVLADVASSTVDALKSGESAAIAGINGQAPVQQVVESVMNAEQALQTAVAVRDKLLSAYQEITRMAI